MELRLLGPLSAVVQGRELAVGGARERAVLAMLLLERGRIVSIDRLVDALWADDPPESARGQVHICISAIRRRFAKAGERNVIETRQPGYVLRIGGGLCDVDEFARLAGEGRESAAANRQQEAVSKLRAALDLWRGAPLADVDSPLVQSAVLGLTELYTSTTEDWLDACLTLGHHEDVIRATATLIASYPLRERLRQQQVIALYRAGRVADALAAYKQAREVFIEELGLEPSPQFQQLERAILTHDQALGAPGVIRREPYQAEAVVPRQLPPGMTDFTGREGLIARMTSLMLPDDGKSPVVVLTGIGGVGKSALAVHVGHLLRDAFPGGQLFADLGEGNARPATSAWVLERFLRALGVSAREIPDAIEDRVALYRSLIWGRRILVVLDDAGAEAQVQDLLQGSAGSAVVITSRRRLTGLSGAVHLEMSVLDASEAAHMLMALSGIRADENAESGSAVQSLVRLCAGLPLALRICAARLTARPHWALTDLVTRLENDGHRLDELAHGELSVRPCISMSYDGLSSDARRLFRLAGLLESDDFPAWVAAPLLDIKFEMALELLDKLVDARMIEATTWQDGGPPRYHMHDLTRIYARERLATEETPEDRSAALGRFFGCLLYLCEEAHRREYGGDNTVMHSGAKRYQLGPERAAELLVKPLRWLERERPVIVAAIAQAARAGYAEYSWDLAISSVALFELGSHFADWRETHDTALAAVRKTGDRRGEAVMQYSRGALSIAEQSLEEAAARLAAARQIFDDLNDRYASALVKRNEAFIHRTFGLLGLAAERYGEVLEVLTFADDPVAAAHTLSGLAFIDIERGQYSAAEDALHRAAWLCRGVGKRILSQLTYGFGELCLARGDLEGAKARFESVLAVSDEFNDRIGSAYAHWGLGSAALGQGQLAQVESHVSAGLQLAGRLGERMVQGRLLLVLGQAHVRSDRTVAAAAALSQSAEKFAALGAVLWRVRALDALARLHEDTHDVVGGQVLSGQALALLGELPSADAAHLADPIAARLRG